MWSQQALDKIVDADDLKISPFREDGKTPGTPTWIWCVQAQGDLYVRGYSGTSSRWYQAAKNQQAGQIHAAGELYDVSFEAITDSDINDAVDAAYREKYKNDKYSSFIAPMTSESTRAATIRIRPR